MSKLLFVQKFVLPYQTSELVQSFIPHHCQMLPLSCPPAKSHLISVTNLCLLNPPVYSSHLLLFLLLTLSVLLGFFSSVSQGRCRELSSCLCCPVTASPHAAGMQQGIPLLQAGAGVICRGRGCLQLCQNLGGKRTAGPAAAGTARGISELSKCPPVSTVQRGLDACKQNKVETY